MSNRFQVVSITKAQADEWVKTKHYSRRPSIFWAGFGLLVANRIEGVCVFGQPSPSIQSHAFKNRDFKLYELSRLVVQSKDKNAASFLVGNSLKRLESPCAVVSYADSEWGHTGIIYQATNWIYTGSTISHDCAYVVDGKRIHPMTLRDRGITAPAKWALENGIEKVRPLPKHRYFYFVGSKLDRKKMISCINYEIVSQYPKPTASLRYDDGPSITMEIGADLFSNTRGLLT
jgi:hypothetical protein